MALSYEFSIGSVRAKETSLLSSSDIEQLVSCQTVSELCRLLSDKGLGNGDTIDELLDDYTEKMWEYLKSVAPDFEIFAPFLYQNDVHNFKAVLKAVMSGREYQSLIMTPCKIDPDVLKKAVENKKMSLLPDWLSESATEAYEILAHTSDARQSDAVVDCAAMRAMLKSTQESGSEFLTLYFSNFVFYNNIKTAIRAAKTNAGKDYLLKALCDVSEFRKSPVISAALKGADALIDEISKYPEYDCKNAIEAYKTSPSAFEKFADNRLMTLAREYCKRASEGEAPLIGYYLGCEAEKKMIHIIASGISTGSDREKIRERLREIYG